MGDDAEGAGCNLSVSNKSGIHNEPILGHGMNYHDACPLARILARVAMGRRTLGIISPGIVIPRMNVALVSANDDRPPVPLLLESDTRLNSVMARSLPQLLLESRASKSSASPLEAKRFNNLANSTHTERQIQLLFDFSCREELAMTVGFDN